MENSERIERNGKVYAIIVRSNVEVEETKFFTPNEYPLQMGIQVRQAGIELKPHTHKGKERVITESQEMFHICEGKVEVKVYDENGEHFSTSTLESGDTVLFARGGHGFKILEKTKLIEVKQGPYTGKENDKTLL